MEGWWRGVSGTINERIKAIVAASGKTKTAFAREINISQPYLSQMCAVGGKVPSNRTIADICREFGVSELWLRAGEGEMYAHEPAGKLDSVNERIKQVRRAKGLTQAELAKNLGLKQNTIATYEMGRQTPSDRTISDICRTFNVSELWLRTGEGEMYVKRSRNEEIAMLINELMREEDTSFRKRFTAAMLELPPELWPELEKFFQKLGG